MNNILEIEALDQEIERLSIIAKDIKEASPGTMNKFLVKQEWLSELEGRINILKMKKRRLENIYFETRSQRI